jgi:hypothetical protein
MLKNQRLLILEIVLEMQRTCIQILNMKTETIEITFKE